MMKLFTYLAAAVVLFSTLPVPALAEEVLDETPTETEAVEELPAEAEPEPETETQTEPEAVTEPVTETETQLETGFGGGVGETYPVIVVEDNSVSSSYSVTTLNDPESEPATDPEQQTMKDVVVMILGDYSPRTQTVTQYLSDGSSESYTEIVPGVAGMDWEWISGAGLFSLVLFSFLKLVGVLLKNG